MNTDRRYRFQRPVVWMAVGLLGGLLFFGFLEDVCTAGTASAGTRQITVLRWLFALLFVLGAVVLCHCGGYQHRQLLLCLACFVLGGLLLAWRTPACLPETMVGQPAVLVGTVAEGRPNQRYLWLQLEAYNGQPMERQLVCCMLPTKQGQWKTQSIGQSLDSEGTEWYPPGTVLMVTGRLQLPQGQRNPGGFDEAAWLRGKGARYLLMAETVTVRRWPEGIRRLSWMARNQLTAHLHQYLPQQQARLAQGILLGDRQQLEDTFYRMSQRMGIAHMFAVSGLHVGFLGAFLLYGMRMCRMERSWLTLLVFFGLLWFYCLVTGLVPSGVRATVMVCLAALATRLYRPVHSLDFLALAALVLLWDNPFLLETVGFQLSFGVTLALLLLVRPMGQWLRSVTGWARLSDGLAVSLAATIGSLPVTAWHFYSISLLGPLFNLCLVPLVSLLVPGLVLAELAALWMPAVAVVLYQLVGMGLAVLLWLMHAMAWLLGSGHWYVGQPHWLVVVVYLAVVALLCGRGRWPHRAVTCGAVAVLLVLLLCSALPPRQLEDELLFLDTGQGSCALLLTREGERVLFDGGASRGELLSVLAWMGINRLDGVILSHGDEDHIRGLEAVLDAMPVNRLLLAEPEARRPGLQPVLKAAQKNGCQIGYLQQSGRLQLQKGDIRLQVIREPQAKQNDCQLTAIWQGVAFPGDLGLEGVQTLIAGQPLRLWVVPHHGSRYSSSAALYRQLKAQGVDLAVISAGQDNRYGHPHSETLEQIRQAGIAIQRTDQSGAIWLRL